MLKKLPSRTWGKEDVLFKRCPHFRNVHKKAAVQERQRGGREKGKERGECIRGSEGVWEV